MNSLFDKKQESLFQTPGKEFVNKGLMLAAETKSLNGAKKYSTSGDPFLDNFASASRFLQPRTFQEIAEDMRKLWSINPLKCLRLAFYMRGISRHCDICKPSADDTVTVKVRKETLAFKGLGLKHEGLYRFLWVGIYHRATFLANLPYYVAIASWKDIFMLMELDLTYNGWEHKKLPWYELRQFIMAGLSNRNTVDLVKKYLPVIKSPSRCNTVDQQARTLLAKFIASGLFKSLYKDDEYQRMRIANAYQSLKSSGNAHAWQKAISESKMLEIDFDTVAGKALSLLVNSKFLKNQGLMGMYKEWIMQQPVAKFTGYPHELLSPLGTGRYPTPLPFYTEITICKQFKGMLEKAEQSGDFMNSTLVVRDTSSSMTGLVPGTKFSAFSVAKSLSLYFSALLPEPFKDVWVEFAHTAEMRKYVGNTVVDKWRNDKSSTYGNTNILSVAELLVKLRKEKHVPESEFPKACLFISDGEFDACGESTNFTEFRHILRVGGFSEDFIRRIDLILWDIPSHPRKYAHFEDLGAGNIYMSGFAPEVISLLFGDMEHNIPAPKNPIEVMNTALGQELLMRLQIVTPKPKIDGKKNSQRPPRNQKARREGDKSVNK